jgi:hypothetical protein
MAYWNSGKFSQGLGSPGNDPGVSAFNSASYINQRMHNLWVECKRAWRTGYMDELNGILDVVYTELYADATPEQVKKIKEFDSNIVQFGFKIRSAKNLKERKEWEMKHAMEIKEKWLYLKLLEKKQGIGKAYKDKFEDDFD